MTGAGRAADLPALVPQPGSVHWKPCAGNGLRLNRALRFARDIDPGGFALVRERWRALGITPPVRAARADVTARVSSPGVGPAASAQYTLAIDSATVRIAARRIDQILHSEEVELHDIHVDYQSPEGATWVMVGDTAQVHPGGTVIDVAGNVELHGTDPNRSGAPVIRADTLSYDVTQAVASTSGDVRIDFLVHTLTARGLVANLREHTIRLESRINGRFQP